jgi:CTP:molybdopterin cytidylyltransferase MocA
MIGVEYPGPAAIILAAGFSRRMGGFDKLARELGPTRGTLLAWEIRNCAGPTTIIVASRTLAESASILDAHPLAQ